MENSKLVGILKIRNYPNFDLFEDFSSRLDNYELEDFNQKLKIQIKKQYIKYLIYLIFIIYSAASTFYLGYYFYEKYIGISILFSVVFVALFIYISKADEIKREFFRFFKVKFLKKFARCCNMGEELNVVLKKSKFLILISTHKGIFQQP